jgi:hypothetical protein
MLADNLAGEFKAELDSVAQARIRDAIEQVRPLLLKRFGGNKLTSKEVLRLSELLDALKIDNAELAAIYDGWKNVQRLESDPVLAVDAGAKRETELSAAVDEVQRTRAAYQAALAREGLARVAVTTAIHARTELNTSKTRAWLMFAGDDEAYRYGSDIIARKVELSPISRPFTLQPLSEFIGS